METKQDFDFNLYRQGLEELAEDCQTTTERWEPLFRLARRVKRLTVDTPMTLETLRETFAFFYPLVPMLRNDDREACWLEYLAHWLTVHTPEDSSTLEVALDLAREQPIEPIPNFGELYQLVASLAYHLQILRGGEPIFLPREKLATMLNTSAMTITRIVKLLVIQKLLTPIDEEYSYKDGMAKQYIFDLSGHFTTTATQSKKSVDDDDGIPF